MAVREEMARLAARWWADCLRVGEAPSVMEQAGWEPKQSLEGMMVDGMLKTLIDHAEKLTAEEIDRFEEKLSLIIQKGYGPGYGRDSRFRISVDYGPDRFITDALRFAGIDVHKTRADSRFPLKTDMYITDECVSVSAGYRAPNEVLYTSKRDVIRKLVVEREWPVFKTWHDEEDPIVKPLCKTREEIAKKNNRDWNHPDVVAAQNAVIAAMQPRKDRDESWRFTRDRLLDALPLMPGGPIENIVNDIWLAIVATDEAYMADRAKRDLERVEDMKAAARKSLPKKLPRKLKKKLTKERLRDAR